MAIKLCPCGSGLMRCEMHDGYGIFLTFACSECWPAKRERFRPDIMERYETDEPIDDD